MSILSGEVIRPFCLSASFLSSCHFSPFSCSEKQTGKPQKLSPFENGVPLKFPVKFPDFFFFFHLLFNLISSAKN